MRRLLYLALVILFVVRIDLWLWDDPRLVLGLPVGLTYHVLFCLLVVGVMGLWVRFGWPEGAEDP